MLETDDIDEDYFIPSTSSTLANIFSNSSTKSSENSSLKYVPPKPNVSSAPKSEDSRTSECILACSLQAFEWFNSVYTPRGKVGFAIVKIMKSGYSNILLYDSNKSTLSCATVQPTLEVKVKGDEYLSYYDNAQKYWCLYGTADDIKAIVKALGSIHCVIGHSPLEDQTPPEPVQIQAEIPAEATNDRILKESESDHDYSTNKKTKQSILNRMASMGQSVLPQQPIVTEKTSDSSDTNDTYEHHKVLRHRASKNIVKKTLDKEPIVDVSRSLTVSNFEPENSSHSNLSDRQLLPLMKADFISSVSAAQDMSVLMSEHRQSNSELRINMGRLTDKMDQLFEKINNIKLNEKCTDFETKIYQKLLGEYEKKIIVYEELIKSKGFDINTINAQEYKKQELKADDEVKRLKDKILILENCNKQKDSQIHCIQGEQELMRAQLSEEKDIMRTQLEQHKEILTKKIEEQNVDLSNKKEAELMNYKAACEQEKFNLTKQIDELKLKLSKKEIEVMNCKATCDKLVEPRKGTGEAQIPDLEVKIKSIMNDTFQSIAANFNDDEDYLGAVIKNTVATVIKEVTLETLKTNKSDS